MKLYAKHMQSVGFYENGKLTQFYVWLNEVNQKLITKK